MTAILSLLYSMNLFNTQLQSILLQSQYFFIMCFIYYVYKILIIIHVSCYLLLLFNFVAISAGSEGSFRVAISKREIIVGRNEGSLGSTSTACESVHETSGISFQDTLHGNHNTCKHAWNSFKVNHSLNGTVD